MKVELLYFDGCPNYADVLPRVRELLARVDPDADVELVRVGTPEDARSTRFLGSPTVRVNGHDVEPGAEARSDFGLKCRLYRGRDGLQGTPPEEWVRAAVARGT